jgi:hypothetical protein
MLEELEFATKLSPSWTQEIANESFFLPWALLLPLSMAPKSTERVRERRPHTSGKSRWLSTPPPQLREASQGVHAGRRCVSTARVNPNQNGTPNRVSGCGGFVSIRCRH